MLSFSRTIRLLGHPLPPPRSRQQIVSLSQFSYVPPVQLTVGRGGGGRGWARRQIIRPQESLALCKSFNTFWDRSRGGGGILSDGETERRGPWDKMLK
jgi:hypothetical protein